MSQCIVEPYRAGVAGYRTGVSLHAHTSHSKESLGFLPDWMERLPVLGRLWARELERHRREDGCGLDLARSFWRPPLCPRAVVESEAAQIRRRFGLEALVSLTDHDSFDGPISLQVTAAEDAPPVSLEWTVHVGGARFHLGVHNIAVDVAQAQARALTTAPNEDDLADLLACLASCPSTLIVLNHPFWDGDVNHALDDEAVNGFLRRHQAWIHAVELNGYRRWSENQRTMALAEQWRLPLVAGGDRHGRAPNALLNLSHATSFDEFVGEIRVDHRSHIVIMPEYGGQSAAREFAALADILGTDPELAEGHRHWFDRVFLTDESGRERPVAEIWNGRIPLWLSSFIGVLRLAGSPSARPLLRVALSTGQVSLF